MVETGSTANAAAADGDAVAGEGIALPRFRRPARLLGRATDGD